MVFFTTQETQPARRPRCTKRVRRPIKVTPCHVGWDTSVRSKSGAFLFNQISDKYRCSPHAHASRTERTRALTTWAMADPHVLHKFIHNKVPSAVAGSSGFPTDGERPRLYGQRSCNRAGECCSVRDTLACAERAC